MEQGTRACAVIPTVSFLIQFSVQIWCGRAAAHKDNAWSEYLSLCALGSITVLSEVRSLGFGGYKSLVAWM